MEFFYKKIKEKIEMVKSTSDNRLYHERLESALTEEMNEIKYKTIGQEREYFESGDQSDYPYKEYRQSSDGRMICHYYRYKPLDQKTLDHLYEQVIEYQKLTLAEDNYAILIKVLAWVVLSISLLLGILFAEDNVGMLFVMMIGGFIGFIVLKAFARMIEYLNLLIKK